MIFKVSFILSFSDSMILWFRRQVPETFSHIILMVMNLIDENFYAVDLTDRRSLSILIYTNLTG